MEKCGFRRPLEFSLVAQFVLNLTRPRDKTVKGSVEKIRARDFGRKINTTEFI